MTTIQLDTLTFNESASSGWVFTDLVDWWGQTDDKKPVNERAQGHGAFPSSRSLRSSRAPGFKAVYLGGTAAEVEGAFDELAAVGAEGPVRMTVNASSGSAFRTVTVQVSPVEDHHGRPTGVVEVDMIARDSRRYEDAAWQTTGPPVAGTGIVWPLVWPLVWPGGGADGRVTLVNRGRAPSAPEFRLTGGFDTAVITNAEDGSRVGFDRPMPSGLIVDIDYRTRRALIDGADASRWLRWREWGDVPALSTRRFQFDVTGASGSPTMQGRVLPAWW